MQVIDEFTYGYTYHVYNRGVNGCNLFNEGKNYEHFIKLYEKHVSPLVETYAFVMMPNHFHFALRVKTRKEIEALEQEREIFSLGENKPKYKKPHQQFSNFLNAYAQAFNKRYKRKGNLFEKRFKRKIIRDDHYFRRIIIYIHNNPIKHKFCENILEYSWSSYPNYVSIDPEREGENKVIGWFDNQANFIRLHDEYSKANDLDEFLEY